jgi:hypothetical protein
MRQSGNYRTTLALLQIFQQFCAHLSVTDDRQDQDKDLQSERLGVDQKNEQSTSGRRNVTANNINGLVGVKSSSTF